MGCSYWLLLQSLCERSYRNKKVNAHASVTPRKVQPSRVYGQQKVKGRGSNLQPHETATACGLRSIVQTQVSVSFRLESLYLVRYICSFCVWWDIWARSWASNLSVFFLSLRPPKPSTMARWWHNCRRKGKRTNLRSILSNKLLHLPKKLRASLRCSAAKMLGKSKVA